MQSSMEQMIIGEFSLEQIMLMPLKYGPILIFYGYEFTWSTRGLDFIIITFVWVSKSYVWLIITNVGLTNSNSSSYISNFFTLR